MTLCRDLEPQYSGDVAVKDRWTCVEAVTTIAAHGDQESTLLQFEATLSDRYLQFHGLDLRWTVDI